MRGSASLVPAASGSYILVQASHHNEVVTELHRRVVDLAVRSQHGPSVLSQTKRLRKKLQGDPDIYAN